MLGAGGPNYTRRTVAVMRPVWVRNPGQLSVCGTYLDHPWRDSGKARAYHNGALISAARCAGYMRYGPSQTKRGSCD